MSGAGRMLSFIAAGDPNRPLVVLLHGVCDAAIAWSDYIDYLSHDFRVVAVDMLGHGLSPRYADAQLRRPFESAYEAFEETVEYLEHVHGGRAIMIGHSMGGAIVTMLVRRRPDLCLGAVVEDPAWLNDEQRQRYVDNAPANAALLHDWASDPANAIRHNQTRRPNWPMEDHIGWAYGQNRCDPRLERTGVVSFAEDWHQVVSSIEVPLVVVSSDDPSDLVGVRGLEEVRAMGKPNLETVFIPGCEHGLRRTDIAAFNQAVTPILHRWAACESHVSGEI